MAQSLYGYRTTAPPSDNMMNCKPAQHIQIMAILLKETRHPLEKQRTRILPTSHLSDKIFLRLRSCLGSKLKYIKHVLRLKLNDYIVMHAILQ
uniref:Uncharacterized protein n=1 Tax=Anguilla anguilla TaxID=7936 RepID=A0A0E9WVJ8_ANGAN